MKESGRIGTRIDLDLTQSLGLSADQGQGPVHAPKGSLRP